MMRARARRKIRARLRRREFSLRLVRKALNLAAEYLEDDAKEIEKRRRVLKHALGGRVYQGPRWELAKMSNFECAARDLRYIAEAL